MLDEPFSIDPSDLEGSILGDALESCLNSAVYVVPRLGMNFVEPRVVVRDA